MQEAVEIDHAWPHIMAHLGAWGNRHLPVSRELAYDFCSAGGQEIG